MDFGSGLAMFLSQCGKPAFSGIWPFTATCGSQCEYSAATGCNEGQNGQQLTQGRGEGGPAQICRNGWQRGACRPGDRMNRRRLVATLGAMLGLPTLSLAQKLGQPPKVGLLWVHSDAGS